MRTFLRCFTYELVRSFLPPIRPSNAFFYSKFSPAFDYIPSPKIFPDLDILAHVSYAVSSGNYIRTFPGHFFRDTNNSYVLHIRNELFARRHMKTLPVSRVLFTRSVL